MEWGHYLCPITTLIINPFYSTDISISHFLHTANSLGSQIHTAPSKTTSQFIKSHSSTASTSTPVIIAPRKVIISIGLHFLSKTALKPLLVCGICHPPRSQGKWSDTRHLELTTLHAAPLTQNTPCLRKRQSPCTVTTLSQVITFI